MASLENRWRGPLVLAVALFLLSSLAFWFEFKRKPETEIQEEGGKKIFAVSEKQVSSILIRRYGEAEIRLNCLDPDQGLCKAGTRGRWEISQPIKAKGDDSAMQSLLSSLNNLNPESTINLSDEPPEQRPALLRQYGLEGSQLQKSPSLQVFYHPGSDTTRLTLGDLHPMGSGRYALAWQGTGTTGVERVLLVGAGTGSLFNKPAGHWREKRIVPLDAGAITRVKLTRGTDSITAERKTTDRGTDWVISGREARAASFRGIAGDIENINSWISSVVFLAGEEYLADRKDSPEGRSLLKAATPALSIELSDGARSFELRILKKKQGQDTVLIGLSPSQDPILRLDSGAEARLSKSLKDLRISKLLGSIERFNARKVIIEGKGEGKAWTQPFSSDSSGANWKSDSGSDSKRAAEIAGLLEKLSGNRVVNAAPDPVTPGDAVKFKMLDAEGKPIREIAFWKKGDLPMARDLGEHSDLVLELDRELAGIIPWEASQPKGHSQP